jgi:hypothetical protein
MNNTFEIVTDPQTGQQIWESKAHKLQVAFSDCGAMDKDEAINFKEELGNNWRLPSVEEFDIMHRELFLNKMADFNGVFFSHSDGYSGVTHEYWTSKFDNEPGCPPLVWGYNLGENGMSLIYNRTVKLGIRLVRSI